MKSEEFCARLEIMISFREFSVGFVFGPVKLCRKLNSSDDKLLTFITI